MKIIISLITILISISLFSNNYDSVAYRKTINNKAKYFLNSITNKQKTIETIIIDAKVDIIKKNIRMRGDMKIYMTSSNKILIETSVLGFKISTLLIKNGKIYFKNNIKNTLKIRRATKRNISRYIPIKLSLNQFKQMIKGAPPVIVYDIITFNNNSELVLKNYKETQYLYFNKNKEIIKMTLFQNNKKRLNIKFLNIKYKNGYSYASKIIFKDYKKNVKSKMYITSIKFNKKINKNIFNTLK